MLAAISGSNLGALLVQLLVAGVIFYLLVWLISWIGVPAPFDKVIKVILGLVVVIFLINLLLGLSGSGHQFIAW